MRIILMSILCALFFSSPIMADDNYDMLFSKLDKNHDNNLSKKEFVDAKLRVDKKKAFKLFPDMRDMDRMNDKSLKESLFDRIDKNHNGVLSKDEWRQVAPNILEIHF